MAWLELKVSPPFVLFILAGIMWLDDRILGGGFVAGAPLFLGLILMAAGFGLAFTGLRTLIGNSTTPSPIQIERAKKLVTSGLYQFTRNPMYLGMVIFLVGVAALFGNIWLLIEPGVFVAYITRFQIEPEERMLAAKFGADYVSYQKRVRRWI